ncbi:receptor-like protein kinase [Musa troglodytarum]|uniref:Receptor-like protein kinase n=1 Tax=Musa troglodytarum TaxID=320322 RepID=A0A9E7G3D9_9LILI|nr:receptor-like protein kinase [Musa troglodytarum]
MAAEEDHHTGRRQRAGLPALRGEARHLSQGHQIHEHLVGRGDEGASGRLRTGEAEQGGAVAPHHPGRGNPRLPRAGVRPLRAAHREERRLQLRRAGAGDHERPARPGHVRGVQPGARHGLGVDADQGRASGGGAGRGADEERRRRQLQPQGDHGEVCAGGRALRARHGGAPADDDGGAEDAGRGHRAAGDTRPADAASPRPWLRLRGRKHLHRFTCSQRPSSQHWRRAQVTPPCLSDSELEHIVSPFKGGKEGEEWLSLAGGSSHVNPVTETCLLYHRSDFELLNVFIYQL